MSESPRQPLQFIVLVALLNAMVAMSIDTMLPAIGVIATELGAAHSNDRQLIVSMFFAGLTLGTLVSGPASDSTGRKPAIIASLLVYVIGSAMCLVAWTFPMLLLGRFIQGFGAAGPRIVSIAMVRDGQKGAAMARVMSFIMSVFMLVPILAPSIGQLVLNVASWRFIFAGFLGMAAIAALWVMTGQEETLPFERRQEFSVTGLLAAARTVVGNRITLGYTLATGSVFASFIAYLGTSPQIFMDLYGQGKLFALWFGGFAVGIALSMVFNGRFVMRLGMQRLSAAALRLFNAVAVVFLVACVLSGGLPPLWVTGLCLFVMFFCSGMLFGNFNAIAMEPMGRIAGMAAAISAAGSTLWALTLGTLAGRAYNDTVTPLAATFALCGAISWAATFYAESGKRRA